MQNSTSVDDVLCRELGLERPDFLVRLLPQLMDLVRASRRLPLGEEHAIRRGSRDFNQSVVELKERALNATLRVLRFVDSTSHRQTTIDGLSNFNLIIDSVDNVLERVDGCIREALAAPSGGAPAAPEGTAPIAKSGGQLAGPAIEKPQVRWRRLINNYRTEFVPNIITKHNLRVPLQQKLIEAQCRVGLRLQADSEALLKEPATAPPMGSPVIAALQSHLDAMGIRKRQESPALPHPYEEELSTLTWADRLFETSMPEPYGRMEDTPLIIVKTEEDLRQMIQEIKATCVGKEIAVDVEHHDFRSYRGFVCLVQISTRTKDFVVDPFDIFEQMHMLNEIFTDPAIIKVLHGADHDVLWLQRDFSVYLVNMFDTGQATRQLRLQGGYSLANLVSHYCDLKLDKKYQTADWRERPLPEEMLYYARCDTHYLLYCFDCLRNALLTQPATASAALPPGDGPPAATQGGVSALRAVLERSAALCKHQHVEQAFDAANASMRMCERFSSRNSPLDARQFRVLQSLADWRDRLARSLDESWSYILPDASLWRLSLMMPTSASALRDACNPLTPVLQEHVQEVLALVSKSHEEPIHTIIGSPQPTAAANLEPLGAEEAAVPAAGKKLALADCPPEEEEEPAAAAKLLQELPPLPEPLCQIDCRPWPQRSCGSRAPIVHVSTGSRPRPLGAGKASALLRAIFEPGSTDEEGEGARGTSSCKAQELHSAMKFMAAAPPRQESEGEELVAVDDEPEAAEKADLVELDGQGADAAAGVAAVAAPAAVEVKPLQKRKRRQKGSKGATWLEAVAQIAASDPYSFGSLGDPYMATPSAELGEDGAAQGPKVKKRRKGRVKVAEQLRVADPYL